MQEVNLADNSKNFSPMFVKEAADLIEKSKNEEAKIILYEGIQNFPNYPTAFILLGNVYCNSGDFDKALENYTKASQILQSEETLTYYKNHIEYSAQQMKLYSEIQNRHAESNREIETKYEEKTEENPVHNISNFSIEEEKPNSTAPELLQETAVPEDKLNSDFSLDDLKIDDFDFDSLMNK